MGNVVFTNGCFDVLHMGHLHLLEMCLKIAGEDGRVIVGLNSDDSVKRLKGPSRPVNKFEHRAAMLEAMTVVDTVLLFEEDTPYKLIESIRPDFIVKGGDYEPNEVVGRDIADVIIVRLIPQESTTAFIERVKRL